MSHRLLLDVSSLLYRAHFAMPDSLRAPDGRPVAAIHGYLGMVTRLLVRRRPGEIVHVYDHDWRPTARTRIYPGYKAERPPEPPELTSQFTLLREVLDATGMPQAQAPAWEAEDAIGAICRQGTGDDRFELVSGDRDLLQLVHDPDIKVLSTRRGVSDLIEYDEATVLDKYGVPADRYAEFAMLRGDPSDGLPGVQGVGEKTARALVETYPSIDMMLVDAAAAEPADGPLKRAPKLRERLLGSVDYLDAMGKIVPINDRAPVAVWSGVREDAAAMELADACGLRGPVQRVLAAIDSLNS